VRGHCALRPDKRQERNADPIWLVQNELWDYLPQEPAPDHWDENTARQEPATRANRNDEEDDDIPF